MFSVQLFSDETPAEKKKTIIWFQGFGFSVFGNPLLAVTTLTLTSLRPFSPCNLYFCLGQPTTPQNTLNTRTQHKTQDCPYFWTIQVRSCLPSQTTTPDSNDGQQQQQQQQHCRQHQVQVLLTCQWKTPGHHYSATPQYER